MALPTNTMTTYGAVGNREDLMNKIFLISPTETPFISMVAGRSKSEATYHEHQTDSLAAVDTANAQLDGDDATGDAIAATTRVGNRTQISRKTLIVSGTQDAVSKAGRRKEMAYQLAKKSKELKRDMEAIITRNQASNAGAVGTARKLGSLEAWFTTNVSRGAAGASGGFSGGVVSAATDGTQRALTEALVKTVIQSCWTNGGEPTIIMVGPTQKVNISAFTGGATRFDRSEDKKLVAAIDWYVSDFGTHKIVPNRFQRDRTLFVLDKSLWATSYLRPFFRKKLGDTGDNTKQLLLVEYTLESRNESGSGVVADLT